MIAPLHIRSLLLVAALGGAVGPAWADDAQLIAARSELQALEVAYRQEQQDFQAARSAGMLSPQQEADYTQYLQTLERLLARQRQQIAVLQGKAPAEAVQGGSVLGAPAQTEEERVQGLDGRLSASLNEFDGMLLREQEEIARKAAATEASSFSARAGASGAGGAADGGQSGSGGRQRPGGRQQQAGGRGGEGGMESEQDGPLQPGTGEGGWVEPTGGSEPTVTAGRSGGGSMGGARGAPQIPDGRDDDVVARQLREAAEKETDPELRERLWNEYRKYKNASR